MNIGITGSRTLSGDQEHGIVADAIYRLDKNRDVLVHGGCTGVDTFAGWCGLARGHRVVTILPANPRHTAAVWLQDQTADRAATVRYMPASKTPYRDRNQAIVDDADRLLAFPRYPEHHPQSKHSGTWQTIRLARKAGKPVEILMLDDPA